KFSMTLIIALSVVIPAAAWAQSPLEVDEFSEFSAPAAQQPKAGTQKPVAASTTIKDGTSDCIGGSDPIYGFPTSCGVVEKVKTIQLGTAAIGAAPAGSSEPGGEKPSQATST